MTGTKRALTVCWSLCVGLVLAVSLAGCARYKPGALFDKLPQCFSDDGAVRACLVTDPGEGNIPIGKTGCYWHRITDAEKAKLYKRSANGRPRQFSFEVLNYCDAKVEVKFELAAEGTLRFLSQHCEPITAAKAAAAPATVEKFFELHKAWIEPGGKPVGVLCSSRPYRKKTIGGAKLHREFRLVVTHYGDDPNALAVEFDPEVVLEKSGG